MATTIEKDTLYSTNLLAPIDNDGLIAANELDGFIISLENEDGSVVFKDTIKFSDIDDGFERNYYSDFETYPFTSHIKGSHNNILTYEISYSEGNIIISYEWNTITKTDISERNEQYKTLTITKDDDIRNYKIKIDPYVGSTDISFGIPGLVPYATPEEKEMFLRGDGTWNIPDGISKENIELSNEVTSKTVKRNVTDIAYILYTDNFLLINNYSSGDDTKFNNQFMNGSIYLNSCYILETNKKYVTSPFIIDTENSDSITIKFSVIYNTSAKNEYENYGFLDSSTLSVNMSEDPDNTEDNTTYDHLNSNLYPISELPTIGESKKFHFTRSCNWYISGGDISTEYENFRNLTIEITNIDGEYYNAELYWAKTENVEKITDWKTINHNSVRTNGNEKNDKLYITLNNDTEQIIADKEYIDISVDIISYELDL